MRRFRSGGWHSLGGWFRLRHVSASAASAVSTSRTSPCARAPPESCSCQLLLLFRPGAPRTKSKGCAFQRSAATLSTRIQTDLLPTMPVVHAGVAMCRLVRGWLLLYFFASHHNAVTSLTSVAFNRVGDWDYYETTPWCRSNGTRCSNDEHDNVTAVRTVSDAAVCEAFCDQLDSCNLYSFVAAAAECLLLRSCGTPLRSHDELDFVAFRPGNVEAGCTDTLAENFNAFAVYDDGSCSYVRPCQCAPCFFRVCV